MSVFLTTRCLLLKTDGGDGQFRWLKNVYIYINKQLSLCAEIRQHPFGLVNSEEEIDLHLECGFSVLSH